MADKTLVTVTVRSGGLTPSDPGAVAELLAFNASVRGAGERVAVCPFCRGLASSEAEQVRFPEGRRLPSSEAELMCFPEGRLATLE